jgi:acyl-CoA dehydrogenase
MDFTLSPEIEDLRQRTRAFVEQNVLPLESDPENFSEHENIPLARIAPVQEKARKAGLWAPQSPKQFGGMALPIVAWAAIYEEAARSLFGPLSINCAAPDDGNMNLLSRAGTPAQQERWLRPIVEGKVKSAFAMTEPAPGAGSDPGMMRTRAERKNGKWIITGRKWFITGAGEAAHFILVARTSDDRRRGLTALLYHRDQPGWRIIRRIPIMGPEEHGGHCELEFDGLEVADENVLLGIGDGLKVTQIRLGPARLTHCMRWLGLAKRCLEIAGDYIGKREGFGVRLADNARGLEARPRRPRAQGDFNGQSARRRYAARGRRHCDPAQRRARLFQRHDPGMDLPRRPGGASGRRCFRSAQHGAGALSP